MDLTYLRTFREVAKRQSFTRAAEELGYAQSSVTMQIQKIEKEYGVPLIERHGRQLRLTPPGEELLKLFVEILDLYDRSKETIAQQIGGTITIGTIDSLAAFYLPPYLQQLRTKFPKLDIHLQTMQEANLLAKIKDGEVDLGLMLDRTTADSILERTIVRDEPLVLIAPIHHPLAQMDTVTLNDLNNCELIVSEESCIYRSLFENLLKEHGIIFRIGFELSNLEAIKRCVMNGLGIALLPKIVAEEEIERGSLAELSFIHPEIHFDLQLLMHPKKWKSQPLQFLIQMLLANH
ncbi:MULTISPECIES: LysR family transcriptional regulator [Paenibacillus]|uniref:LysR family transcriptional regulator n=1 Tax=Paenibacillus TaxID=44249 RepID=UPI0003E2B877|nr:MULTISPECIES: LysR family transcriptional regulator [Paenibacillus]AIQ75002.1 LysR family transcriptional regulator [Paenibacillus odorifer]ETT45867.1 LysR family transcriptional regulator [Paenibacillus sp. FSL H8-237]MEC0133269.1 LysR family transcriptional regulator [Paenibacillus odorifer]MEC0223302.1 LysR family transcriptional regulator [Paenibacillus odorifer]OMC94807.1 LysR family transcriptional regulator [Paenibacillus odorifer]